MLERTLLQMLKESRYTTVLSGYEMLLENGYPGVVLLSVAVIAGCILIFKRKHII